MSVVGLSSAIKSDADLPPAGDGRKVLITNVNSCARMRPC